MSRSNRCCFRCVLVLQFDFYLAAIKQETREGGAAATVKRRDMKADKTKQCSCAC